LGKAFATTPEATERHPAAPAAPWTVEDAIVKGPSMTAVHRACRRGRSRVADCGTRGVLCHRCHIATAVSDSDLPTAFGFPAAARDMLSERSGVRHLGKVKNPKRPVVTTGCLPSATELLMRSKDFMSSSTIAKVERSVVLGSAFLRAACRRNFGTKRSCRNEPAIAVMTMAHTQLINLTLIRHR
jgi:hypothetical protein